MQFPEPTIERPVTPPAATVGSDLRNGESSNAGPLRYSPPELSHGIFAAINFDKYILESSVYDEMFQPGGAPREHCRRLHETLSQLSVEELSSIQERVTRSFSNEGISFTVYGDEEGEERIIPVDCLPRVLSGAEWGYLETGLAQRVKALNLFLEDVYGEARIIDDGVIPADMVYGCPQYRMEMRGFSAPHGAWVAICGTDLVRTNDGFRVLEDNLRVPSGVSYMIASRKAVKASLRQLYRSLRVQEVEQYGRLLLETLLELAPSGRSEPCIALLTPGVYNSAFYEYMFLAHETRRGVGGGPGPAGERWIRVHADHHGPAPGGRGVPPGGRRFPGPPGFPSGFPPRKTRGSC